jgi:hypothetical protein
MSQALTQTPDVGELDARVDALMADIARTTASITGTPELTKAEPSDQVIEAPVTTALDEQPETLPPSGASATAVPPAPSDLPDADLLDYTGAAETPGGAADARATDAVAPSTQPNPLELAAAELAQTLDTPAPAADEIPATIESPVVPATDAPQSGVTPTGSVASDAPVSGASIDDVLADAAAELAAALPPIERAAVAGSEPIADAAASVTTDPVGVKPIDFNDDDFATADDVAAQESAGTTTSASSSSASAVAPTDASSASPDASAAAVARSETPVGAPLSPLSATAPEPAQPQTKPPSIAPAFTPDAGKIADLESRANQPPVADIEALDKALAANAEKSVAEATANPAPTPAAPVSDASAPAPAAPSPKPATSTPPKPVPAPASAPETLVTTTIESAPVEQIPLRKRVGGLFRPVTSLASLVLMPIANLHAKMPEGTRQTLGFLAMMQIFAAAVVWGWIFTPKLQKDVEVDTAGVYASDAEAHEAAEKAHTAKAAGGHGEAKEHGDAGGHGEAKADAHGDSGHAKKDDHGADKSKKNAHGSDAHGKKDDKKKADAHGKPAEKKTASKSSSKKADAKKDAHGGH